MSDESETHEAALSDERLREIIAHAEMVGANGTPSIVTGDLAALATELLARRTQPSAGEVAGWLVEWPNALVPNWIPNKRPLDQQEVDRLAKEGANVTALYATPPDQSRVERLEADMERIRLLCESEDGNQTEAIYEVVCQALHGVRP